jgi:hypothetical protein
MMRLPAADGALGCASADEGGALIHNVKRKSSIV